MLPYPTELPIESITTIWNIVKNKEVEERKDELALAAWNIQGFLFASFFGVPDTVPLPADLKIPNPEEAFYQITEQFARLRNA